jgi:hypothetical protein
MPALRIASSSVIPGSLETVRNVPSRSVISIVIIVSIAAKPAVANPSEIYRMFALMPNDRASG